MVTIGPGSNGTTSRFEVSYRRMGASLTRARLAVERDFLGTGREAVTRTRMWESDPIMGLLANKKLLITGVLTDDSIAFGVAKLAQEEGAEIVLTGFGRAMKLTERTARKLPDHP